MRKRNKRVYRSLAALQSAISRGEVPNPAHITVLHAAGCSPNACWCRPRYLVQKATTDTVLEGAESERQWRKESVS